MSKETHKAMRILYSKIYDLDKEFSFRLPQKKADMQKYTTKMRNIVEEALDIADISKIVGHEFDMNPPQSSGGSNFSFSKKKKADSQKEENSDSEEDKGE